MKRREERGIEGVLDIQHAQPMEAIQLIRSGKLTLANAIRYGHHDVVGKYLRVIMSEAEAANTYRDLVSGVAGWY